VCGTNERDRPADVLRARKYRRKRRNKENVDGTVCVVEVMRYWNREEQEGTFMNAERNAWYV
jgi:hypothetical protein